MATFMYNFLGSGQEMHEEKEKKIMEVDKEVAQDIYNDVGKPVL